MPVRLARRRCATAVFLPLDRAACEAASGDVMSVLRRFTAAVEVWGWDEAFLEVRGHADAIARDVRDAVRDETGLSCSVGIGDNKLRAKTASAFAKPGGIYRLDASRWPAVMGDRPARDLWGIGPKTARRLADAGISTVRELAESDVDKLESVFGARTGPWLVELARGEDWTPVSSAPRRAKSRSFERTFDDNVVDEQVIRAEVERMARDLAGHAREQARVVAGVTVKLRFAPFVTRSHGRRLDHASDDPEAIVAATSIALSRFALDRPVRLVGVKVDYA
jgi:DNA polymerase-4